MAEPGNEFEQLDLGLPGFLEAEVSRKPTEPDLKPADGNASPANAKKPSLKKSGAAKSELAKTESAKTVAPKQSAASQRLPADPTVDPPTFETHPRRSFWSMVPSWAISTAVHVAALLILAAWNIEPIQKELSLLLTVGEASSDSDALEEFDIDSSMAELQSEPTDEAPSNMPIVDPTVVDAKVEVDMSSMLAAVPDVSMPSLSQSLAPSSGIAAQSTAALRAALNSRSKESKRELLKKYGGTTETERAVKMALDWLAMHQNPETGAWNLNHTLICGGLCDHPGRRPSSPNAATGMALLCFLGAGQTHLEGEYKDTVFKGLSFLIQSMRVQQNYGAWYRGDGHGQGLDDMYAHGIASIAMCEAYGMTHDERLLEAAQLSINYMTYAQNPITGGWHYSPFPVGALPGDTSVVGWQMMAIKSAAMAGLNFDLDSVRKANLFLDSMMVPNGYGYHYAMESKLRNPADYRPAMTACGVLCRMYSGWNKEEETIKAAVAKFNADGPSPSDSYYNYYATQVMKQYGGPEWESWNVRNRDRIVSSQVQSGHGAGSWYIDEGLSSDQGGRLYVTCMQTMMLEVYYRYMPLYGEQGQDDTFQL